MTRGEQEYKISRFAKNYFGYPSYGSRKLPPVLALRNRPYLA
jgi:hypothetical protein